MYRDTVNWATSKMSAHTSSMMFCRRYPQVRRASRKVSSRGRPSLIPWFLEELTDHIFQFIELH